ncbi:MAG: hypothetical protein HYX42_16670 [Polaromonas sp.]|uniref:hypothetical protein n=1 Tax=Polaromonas sp. TaxID=1869339 RepID=UPI0025CF217A|nr:hypothetical protein [Polaromonas sp.]MBI2727877.1 hypothetical protein [Polaromonas sp.]
MNKSTMSVLLAAMMAVSGFAAAQTSDSKSGTQGGAGPTGASGMSDGGTSVKSRAEVKAEIVPQKSGIGGGSGTSRANNPNTEKTTEGGAMQAPKMTAAERKAKRAEARAARQARLSGNAGNTPQKEGKSSN